jgi:DNA polymerase III alpha subunit
MKQKLRKLCFQKLSEKFSKPSESQKERLEFELHQIIRSGADDVFFVSYHMVQMIRAKGGLIGSSPAFSSASFVLYLLGVSAVNPMEHGLLFEHFFPVDRIASFSIGMTVDEEVLKAVRNELNGSEFLIDNLRLEEQVFCDRLVLRIDDNAFEIIGSKMLSNIQTQLKMKNLPTSLKNIAIDNIDVFRKLESDTNIIKMGAKDSIFLAGFEAEHRQFLGEFAPRNIEELAQVLAFTQPWCNYDLKSILKRRSGVKDLTQFQEKYFGSTYGLYIFPEQISLMLLDYLGFTKQEVYRYQQGERKKKANWQMLSEELYSHNVNKYGYDKIAMAQIWENIKRAHKSMTDKSRVIAEALTLYYATYLLLE